VTGRYLVRVALLLGALGMVACTGAAAQPNPALNDAGVAGVRHQINATVRADGFFYGRSGAVPDRASLTVQVMISDHSQEFRFFGGVTSTFSDFSPADGSPEQKIWEDPGCHHERAIPKFTVTGIDGEMWTGEKQIPVNARTRQIGLFLPPDEITQGRRLTSGADSIGPFTVTRVETRATHLFVDVKLYTSRCELR
jgi:hypothetical protein